MTGGTHGQSARALTIDNMLGVHKVCISIRSPRKIGSCAQDVLRSRKETPTGVAAGAYTFDDVLNTPGVAGQAMNFYYQYTPQVYNLRHTDAS